MDYDHYLLPLTYRKMGSEHTSTFFRSYWVDTIIISRLFSIFYLYFLRLTGYHKLNNLEYKCIYKT